MSLLLLRRIENRHILWTALSMVAIGLIMPGGFGVKPPQWFPDCPSQVVASASLAEPNTANTSTSVATPEVATKTDYDLTAGRTTQQAQEPAQPSTSQQHSQTSTSQTSTSQTSTSQTSTSQTSTSQTHKSNQHKSNHHKSNLVTVPLKFARYIPPKHFELTGDTQKQSFIKLVLPLILAVNDELLRRRKAVEAAVKANDRNMLDQWAVLYRIDPENFSDIELAERLLRRVDTIPVALP